MQCPGFCKDVNYTYEILRDVVTRGIVDTDVQLDPLGDCNQNMTLQEVLRFVEAKEAGKRSASRLMSEPQSSADAMRSSYKKNPPDGHKVDPMISVPTVAKLVMVNTCHPTSGQRSGHSAFIHTCRHCDREHHFDNMCRSRSKPKDVLNVDREGAIFDSLYESSSISQQHDGRTLSLDHHMYNEICDQWSKQAYQSQLFIKLQTTVHSEDYAAHGFKGKISQGTASLPAMADTGCQSCLAGVNILHPLGLTEDDLIPVTMKMHAANNNRITILGATVLRFSGKSETDKIINTRQIVYITDSSSKIFLSREACVYQLLVKLQTASTTVPYVVVHNVNFPHHYPKDCHTQQPLQTMGNYGTFCLNTINQVHSTPVSINYYR